MTGMSPEELDRKLGNFITNYPDRIADALEAVVAHDMVKHARDDHDRIPPAEQRLMAYKSIALRKAGKQLRVSTGRSGAGFGGARFKHRTGILSQSIRAGKAKKTATGAECEFGAYAEYSYFVEMGSSANAPYPFLRPAVEANKDKLKDRVRDAIKTGVITEGLD